MLEHLWGIRVEAVVMLDRLSVEHRASDIAGHPGWLESYFSDLESNSASVLVDSARLSAVGHWFATITSLVFHPTTARTLLIPGLLTWCFCSCEVRVGF